MRTAELVRGKKDADGRPRLRGIEKTQADGTCALAYRFRLNNKNSRRRTLPFQ